MKSLIRHSDNLSAVDWTLWNSLQRPWQWNDTPTNRSILQGGPKK